MDKCHKGPQLGCTPKCKQNNCQKIWPAHYMITKRGSYFSEKYILCDSLTVGKSSKSTLTVL